ncbi:MAG: hypothetical protein KDJ99_24875 [Candidatus Competibacteraceae bacterium]|nr:hypothetical protein [Candidatus Competibacteraceae bacterium]
MIGLFPADFLFESKTKPVREQRLELLSDPQGRIRGLIFCKGDTAEQLIIRPPFAPSLFRKTAQLQTINPKRPIRHTLETSFLRELTAAICARRQQAIGGEDNYGFIQDRSVYFGLRAMAARIVNHSLNQVLAEASQPDLQTARRFSTVWRYSIYMATCLQGERLRQLADTFPLLLVELATSMPEAMIGQSSSKATALQMVLAGKPLKQIAEHMQTPYVLRLFKPGAIRRLSPELREFAQARPDILYSYLPKTTHQQRLWLAAVNRAIAKRDDLGDGFIEWTARYGTQLGQTLLETDAHLTNLSDFITASQYQNIACFLSPDSPRYLQTLIAEAVMDKARGSEFITRRFNSAMSLQTV